MEGSGLGARIRRRLHLMPDESSRQRSRLYHSVGDIILSEQSSLASPNELLRTAATCQIDHYVMKRWIDGACQTQLISETRYGVRRRCIHQPSAAKLTISSVAGSGTAAD